MRLARTHTHTRARTVFCCTSTSPYFFIYTDAYDARVYAFPSKRKKYSLWLCVDAGRRQPP